MSYTCQYLQFGNNQNRVPGYENDLILLNYPNAPIPEKLVDPNTDELWNLIFSYQSGAFYDAGENVPAQNGATIKSWYSQGGSGPHYLKLTPFITGDSDDAGFVQASGFVEFSEPATTDNSVNTDTINSRSVTATVHSELPEYEKIEISSRSTSHSIIITTKTTHAIFDRIFVYAGKSIPINNTITVPKGRSCYALAIFKAETSSSSKEISTLQWPEIPRWEWPMIVAEIVKEIIDGRNGEIFQHLSPKLLAKTEPEVLKKAVSSISKRMDSLDKIKSVISGLSDRKTK